MRCQKKKVKGRVSNLCLSGEDRARRTFRTRKDFQESEYALFSKKLVSQKKGERPGFKFVFIRRRSCPQKIQNTWLFFKTKLIFARRCGSRAVCLIVGGSGVSCLCSGSGGCSSGSSSSSSTGSSGSSSSRQ